MCSVQTIELYDILTLQFSAKHDDVLIKIDSRD